MCWTAECCATCTPDAPAGTRRFVVETFGKALTPGGPAALATDTAELVTSELVTNAVKASGHTITVQLVIHHRWAQLAVSDDGAGRPVLADHGRYAPSGRGLRIVQALATRWGWQRNSDGGKAVWCRFGLPETATAQLPCRLRAAPGTGTADRPTRPTAS